MKNFSTSSVTLDTVCGKCFSMMIDITYHILNSCKCFSMRLCSGKTVFSYFKKRFSFIFSLYWYIFIFMSAAKY
jgi:hypothetical protein